jgi:tetratricopeptide (TPR) repeat protein
VAAGPELDLGDIDRLDNRFKRRLAACIILVTLLSSAVALLAANAGARSDENAREAERNAAAAMAEDAQAYVEFFGGLAGFAEAQPVELRRWVAESRALAFPAGDAGDAARWQQAARSLANLSPLLEAGTASEDEAENLFQDLYAKVDLASLRQAARRGTADAWGAKSDQYSAVLTMLAIVLSVLGLGATFGQRLQRTLIRPAVAVALGCLVFTAAVAVPRVREVPEGALRQVAEGDRRLALRNPGGAVEAYTAAIGQAPGYAVAYVRRAGAYLRQGSPEQAQSYVFAISDPAARARSIADLERAFELKAGDDLLAQATLGANYFFDRRYGDAEVLAQRALDRNPRLTAARLTLGLAQAAQGRADEAAGSFRRVAAEATATRNPQERDELFAAGHATLVQLGRREPQRAELVRLLKEQLTSAQTAIAAERPVRQLAPGEAVSELSLSFRKGSLSASYRQRGVRDGDVLAWIIYTRATPGAPWRQQPELRQFEKRPGGTGTGQTGLPEDRCPAPGEYRVDLYLEGVLQASAEATRPPAPERLARADDPLATFDLCHPAAWKVLARRPGLLDVGAPAPGPRMTVSVFPAPPELVRPGTGQELAAVADRLAASRRFTATAAAPSDARSVSGRRGTLRTYQRPGEPGRTLRTWVSLGPDAVLRTVVLQGRQGDQKLLDRLLAGITFLRLDG